MRAICLGVAIVWCTAALGQNAAVATTKIETNAPHAECTLCAVPMIGRSGAAFGEGLRLQLTLFHRAALYVMPARSGIGGYTTRRADVGRVVANERDISLTLGGSYRLLRRGFVSLGPFFQVTYASGKVGARYALTYPDSEAPGGLIEVKGSYREHKAGPLITPGLHVELQVPRFPLMLDGGRSFGSCWACQTAGGFYFVGGPMLNLGAGVKSTVKFFSKIF